MSIFLKIYVFLTISRRRGKPIFTKYSREDCNRKVKILGFWTLSGWEGSSQRSLSLRTQLHKCNVAAKGIYLWKKETCLILVG